MKPLDGKRIVTLAMNVPGPIAIDRLCDMGADVLKIEPPAGDPLSNYAPQWYAEMVHKVDIIILDLKAPESHEVLRAELDEADLLITSMRPTALLRRGLDHATISRRFPQLSMISITGYSGDRGDIAGHDLTYQAESGLVNPPHLPRSLFADLFAAERVVSAALQLFLSSANTGVGSTITVSIEESVSYLTLPSRFGLMGPTELLGGGDARYGLYETKDGWIALAALEPHFWARLLNTLDVRSHAKAALVAAFGRETTEYWVSLALEHDLPISKVALPICERAS